MADSTITQLNPLGAADVQPDLDVLAIADVSTSETKKIKAADVVTAGIGGVADNSINGSAIVDNSIPGSKLEENSVTTRELAPSACETENYKDKSVTQEKLADGSVGSDQIVDGSITGDKLSPDAISDAAIPDRSLDGIKLKLNAVTADELAADSVGATELADNAVDTAAVVDAALTTPKYQDGSVTNDKLASGIDGQKLSVGSVDTNQLADGAVTSDKTAGDFDGSEFLPQPAGSVLAGPANGVDAKPSFRQLTSQDLPALDASSLPIASITQLGVVQVGTGLTATAGGVLGINNAVAPGTGEKITYNAQGLITGSADLVADDIPGLSADKITSGEFGTDRIADESITRPKLADYSIALIQEAQPTGSGPGGAFIGCLWFQPLSGQLRMYDGNVWQPVGFGRLSADNLRWGGTIDATTGFVTGVTPAGTNGGLQIGEVLPEATDTLGGLYVLISEAGDQISATPGVSYQPGDWCLCVNKTDGWVRINTLSSGGGGGGGASTLNDLLDVTLTSASEGQYLQLQADGQWQNVTLTADVESVNGQTGVVVLSAADVGALASGDNVSELVNDAGYLDEAEVKNILGGKNPDGTPDAGGVTYLKPGDNVTELTNNAGYITAADVPAAVSKTSELTNDGEDGINPFITAADIPAIPENTSDLTNDSGFITSADVGDGKISIQKADGTPVGDFTVNQSGDKIISLPADVVPSAPGDGQLTIKDAAGNELGVFTANQATGNDTEVQLTAAAVGALAPGDDISELNNDAGFITAGDIPAAPVTSVNGETGDVVLEASDVGALPDTTPLDFVPLGSWASIPVLT